MVNNRHRRVARLSRKDKNKIDRTMQRLAASIEPLGYSAEAALCVIEQMCRPGKVEQKNFEKLTEVTE